MFTRAIYILKASDPFKLKPHEEATVNLELKKARPCYRTILTGRVCSRYKHSPIKNATIKVFDRNFTPLFHTVTDENGIYIFKNVLTPGEYKVIATAVGYNTSRTKRVCIKEDSITKLSFTLRKSLIFVKGVIYGKIFETSCEKAIEDTSIYLISSNTFKQKIYKTTSNSSGQYLIYNVIPNSYKIIAKKQGYLASLPIKLTITKYDRIMLNLDLIRDPKYSKNTISGRIPINRNETSGIAVFLYIIDKHGNEKLVQVQTTNKSGIYIFSNLENGVYIVKRKCRCKLIFQRCFTLY